MSEKISIQDVEQIFQIECHGHGCSSAISETTPESVVKIAEADGWVRRDFDEHFHGILCGSCDKEFS
jgi:hypothetical protein